MAEITLANGGVAIVDECDIAKLAGYRWLRGTRDYVVAYSKNGESIKQVIMHRLIIGAQSGAHVDHINGVHFDNRKSNLRTCTHADNMKNRKIHKNNALGVKGVYLHRNRYSAQIRVDKKKVFLGCFDTLEEAALAYQAASKKYHGAFSSIL